MKGCLIRMLLVLPLLFCSAMLYAQMAQNSPINLDFSQVNDQIPTGWYIEGSELEVISKEHPTATGQSLRLTRTANTSANYSYAVQAIPFNFIGKTLTFSGWVKTEQISSDGGAALWIRLDSGDTMVTLNNMADRVIKGSEAWQHIEVSVEITPSVDMMSFGTILSGTGTAYFADLHLTLDGLPLDQAPKPTFIASEPHQFEQDSGIRITQLSAEQQQHLAVLAKVWGFVKYYHPESAKGNISMDAELFTLIPQLLTVSSTERDKKLLTWIKQLGKVSPCNTCKDSSDAALTHPAEFWLSWGISAELSQQLTRIHAAEIPAPHFWVKPEPQVSNPFFNEKPYAEISYQDSGYRLLALFRLWNIIHYYSPYRDLTEQPWEQVLLDAIPAVISAKSELDYQLALAKVVYAIHDSHSLLNVADISLMRNFIGTNIIPVDVRFVEQQAVVYQVYQDNLPIKVGDIITHIDNRSIAERLEYLRPILASSNEPTRMRDFAWLLPRVNTEQAVVKIIRDNQALTVQLPTLSLNEIERQFYYYEHGNSAYHHMTPEIGYVRLDKIAGVNIDDMMQQLADTKGLVLDLRNYPSDFVVFSLGQYFYPQPFPFASFTIMQPNNPGQFNWTSPITVGPPSTDYYKGKIAILINEQTQSLAEFSAMAFRGAPKAKVFGSTTAGADGDISLITLPGGHSTVLSGIGVFYPDKTPTQRVGIIPDVEVLPTIAGIKAGKDEVLERAIQYIEAN